MIAVEAPTRGLEVLREYILDLCHFQAKVQKHFSGPGMSGNLSPLAFTADIHPHGTTGDHLRDLGFHVDPMGKEWVYYLDGREVPEPPAKPASEYFSYEENYDEG